MRLLMVDTTGTQRYIFGSNRLRENIGASHLVAQATSGWALDQIRQAAPKSNLKDDLTLDHNLRIKSHNLDAEVVYSGGGNLLVLIQDESVARTFIQKYSRQLLCQAPELNVAIEQIEFDFAQNNFAEKLNQLQQKLSVQKQSRNWPAPLLGLGVTRACQSTGLPAVGFETLGTNNHKYAVSADIQAKHQIGQKADERFKTISEPSPYTYPHQLDELGRSEDEHSYIAVVHADSNNMGERIKNIIENTKNPDPIRTLRNFSLALDSAAEKALKTLIDTLKSSIESSQITHAKNPDLFVPLSWKETKYYLPFRPLVIGGDDITFVCDGRLGLSLAILFLREFERLTTELPDKSSQPATACAGIAIVKSHYPFARAYTLAEELCANAKRFRRQKSIQGSCLDWHYATSGLAGSINAIRKREYKVAAGSLTLKPLALNAEAGLRSWPVVKRTLDIFQDIDQEEWTGKRNKLKMLREVLREGPGAIQQFLDKYDLKQLPCLPAGGSNLPELGWEGKFCAYYDAIEATDWYIPLEDEDNINEQEADHAT